MFREKWKFHKEERQKIYRNFRRQFNKWKNEMVKKNTKADIYNIFIVEYHAKLIPFLIRFRSLVRSPLQSTWKFTKSIFPKP